MLLQCTCGGGEARSVYVHLYSILQFPRGERGRKAEPSLYLHGCEVPDVVELKHNLHVAFGKALVAPAHVVVPGPHAVHVTVEEVIQTCGSIRQLAKAFCQPSGGQKEK